MTGFFISDAMAAAPADPAQPGLTGMLLPLVFLAIFYFLLIRPQQKRAKEHRNMVASLTRGSEVVTNGGVLGKVVDLDDNFVHLEVAEQMVIQVQRPAVASVMPKGTYKTQQKKAVTKN